MMARYNGPAYSCPHFDEALQQLAFIRKALKEIDQFCDEAEEEIEKARDINAKLRDDNLDLTSQVESLDVEIDTLREQVYDLEKEKA